MIGYLNGTILNNNKNPILLLVGGVGFQVQVPPGLIAKLVTGSTQSLYTHMHVRDDAIELFGFSSQDDIDLFNMLITVSGIGPKTGLLVIDRGVKAVTNAIMRSDVDFFTSIPRLGKKNSQKIIIELKSKLGSLKDLDLSDTNGAETKEIIEALMSMGFARNESYETVKKLEGHDVSVEEKIRQALKILGKNR
jgi:holliday junction DNA helicase RuvA